jgi:hypothetical protein
MDVLYFLKRRTTFICRFYEHTSVEFSETKRKISEREPPYDGYPPGFDPQDGEPPFLQEYQEAEEGLDFLGQSCVSYLSASLNLYLNEMRREMERMFRLPPFDGHYAKIHGWFPAYRKWFAELGIDLAASGGDLDIVEQVVLTRNHAQHPGWIADTYIAFRGKTAEKFRRPFFGHEFEWERERQEPDARRMLPWLLQIRGEKFMRAVHEVEKLCTFIDEQAWAAARRRRA